jgi:hypothetical protein
MIRPSRLARGFLLAVIAVALLGGAAAEAKSTTRSSPSPSTTRSYAPPPRAPSAAPPPSSSYSAPSPSAPRPSSGYSAPSPSAPSASSSYRPPTGSAAPAAVRSGSDAAMTRQGSANAYTSYRATQSNFRAAAAPPPLPPSNTVFAGVQRVPSYSVLVVHRNSYYSSWGYAPPSYIYGYAPHFGIWDAIFIWSLASAASNAAQADWFYHHQYDQGYVDWRQQAEIEARNNADLRAQLTQIDQRIATLQEQNVPRDPNYLPPGADAQVALAAENVVSHDAKDADVDVTRPQNGAPPAHSSHLWLDLLLGGAAIAIVVFALRRRAA